MCKKNAEIAVDQIRTISKQRLRNKIDNFYSFFTILLPAIDNFLFKIRILETKLRISSSALKTGSSKRRVKMGNGINGRKVGFAAIVAMVLFCIFSVGSFVPITRATKAYKKVGCKIELDRGVLPAENPQNVVVKVTLDAPAPPSRMERPPVNIAIVLDRSGSMSGQKLEKAKQAAIEALRRLGQKDMFSVIVYDHNVKTIVPAQSARNVEWIESRIRGIGPGGNTALFGGVSQGASEVRKNLSNKYVHRIILLSDGLANVGPSSPEDLGRLGAALIKESISVTTIGVGTDYNEDLMARLSQNSDGNTYFVESSRDLPKIFAAELGDVLNVVAKKVSVIIQCPNGVEPVRIIGRDGRINGGTVALSLNQLYGGQEKYVLVEVRVPAGKNGEDTKVAMAEVTYVNPFTRKKEISKGHVNASFSRDPATVEKSANIGVKRDVQLNKKALAEEEAIRFSDDGKAGQAVDALLNSAQQLKDFGTKYKDPEILEKARELEDEADALKTEGMTKKKRKELRTKSYQMKNQQKKY
ncbi:von Willebrand factor type A domain protein [delta proteobacterium NaphS2]|nr:von Willebrand factor type A domain protein [delta proteobacterium NaphS2]